MRDLRSRIWETQSPIGGAEASAPVSEREKLTSTSLDPKEREVVSAVVGLRGERENKWTTTVPPDLGEQASTAAERNDAVVTVQLALT